MDKKCKYYCYRDTQEAKFKHVKNIDKLKLVVFDMDGVLTDIYSSWKYVHDYFDTSNENSVQEYLKGNIDDAEFIRRDANLWKENGKNVSKKKLEKILSEVPIMNGAEKCIYSLREKNIKTAIISAGLDILANRIGSELNIDYIVSNGIKTDRYGYINGEGILGVKLIHKNEAVKNLVKQIGLSSKNIAAVGNSCFDISMFETAGLAIAFNPNDDCIKKSADIVINEKYLSKILPYLFEYL